MTRGPALEEQGRRLTLAAGLTWRARRCAARAADGDDLLALARELIAIGPPVERAHRIRFDPPYPGSGDGVEEVRGGRRLVLACRALDAGSGAPEAVVFTTLIAGREPLVSVAPYRPEIDPRTRGGGS